jgi:hypothetical protein
MKRITVAAVVVLVGILASNAAARIPPTYRNCAALNNVYPHGLDRANARDKTSGTEPCRGARRGRRRS